MKGSLHFMSLKRALFLLTVLALTLSSVVSASSTSEDDFDRLDGRGKSGKRVDVIEWEGNLEIHVYPKNSLAGLALKWDDQEKFKKVMVIGYRFQSQPKEQLIRRALVSIPFQKTFYAFQDPTPPDYDKVIISNQILSEQVVALALDPAPQSLYPLDGKNNSAPRTPASENAATGSNPPPSPTLTRSTTPSARPTPAAEMPSETSPDQLVPAPEKKAKAPVTQAGESVPEIDEDGGIRHFSW
jgi:hypothetical protein